MARGSHVLLAGWQSCRARPGPPLVPWLAGTRRERRPARKRSTLTPARTRRQPAVFRPAPARLLLERGASPDALHGEAYRLAAWYERQDIVQLLLRHGAAPTQGPPATLPSGPAQDDGSNKENLSP